MKSVQSISICFGVNESEALRVANGICSWKKGFMQKSGGIPAGIHSWRRNESGKNQTKCICKEGGV